MGQQQSLSNNAILEGLEREADLLEAYSPSESVRSSIDRPVMPINAQNDTDPKTTLPIISNSDVPPAILGPGPSYWTIGLENFKEENILKDSITSGSITSQENIKIVTPTNQRSEFLTRKAISEPYLRSSEPVQEPSHMEGWLSKQAVKRSESLKPVRRNRTKWHDRWFFTKHGTLFYSTVKVKVGFILL